MSLLIRMHFYFFLITPVSYWIIPFSFVVDPECVYLSGWNTSPSKIRKVFFQGATLLLGPDEDAEMQSDTESESPGCAKAECRSCCPSWCLAVVPHCPLLV